MAKADQRRRFFDLYSANLALFKPEYKGLFACPICRQLYDARAVEGDSLSVDLAHTYPESCGGRLRTLTCARCNSRIGSKYDSHLAREHHLWDALGGSGRRPIDIRLRYAWGSFGARAVFTEAGGYSFREIAKQTDPKVRQETVERFMAHDGKSDLKFTMVAPGYIPTHLTTALFHAAYLHMFRHFGYEYILFCRSDWIRDILLATEPREDLKICTLEVPRDEGAHLGTLLHSVGVAKTTTGGQILVVALPHPDPKFILRMVALPGFGYDGLQHYQTLTGSRDQYARSQFVFLRDEPAIRLAQPRFTWFGRSFWQRAFATVP